MKNVKNYYQIKKNEYRKKIWIMIKSRKIINACMMIIKLNHYA